MLAMLESTEERFLNDLVSCRRRIDQASYVTTQRSMTLRKELPQRVVVKLE